MVGNYEKPTTALPQWTKSDRFKLKDSSNTLHKETLKIKQSLNRFQDENIKLKTKIQQSGKEIEKKQKIIQGLMEQIKSDSGQISSQYFEAPIIISLKRQLKELKEEQKAKQTELDTMKSRLKINHFKELDTELKANEKECARLKGIVIDMIKNQSATVPQSDIIMLENRLTQQDQMINNLKTENINLAANIQKKEEELLKCKKQALNLEKKIEKAEVVNRDNTKTKKVLIENKKEIVRLSEQVEMLKAENKDKEIITLKNKINELTKKQQELNEQLKKKTEELKSPSKDNKDVDKSKIDQLKNKIKNCIMLP